MRVTMKMIDAAAEAAYTYWMGTITPASKAAWPNIPESRKQAWRELAKQALRAALAKEA